MGGSKKSVKLATSRLSSIIGSSVLEILNGDINKIEFGDSFMKLPIRVLEFSLPYLLNIEPH